ncbi:hypothetical protein ACIRPQ_28945 [Streptomyces sp. NPDC101213]|uniref:hypothetical protein n=1 Tax=Streptomyces sp. NPDC101213 TaxID=3366130 RepID=UPI0038050307
MEEQQAATTEESAMGRELITDLSRLAVYVVKNKARAEEALFELADGLVEEMGELEAYRATADALRKMTFARSGWLSNERERLVRRVAGDMRELVGLERVEYADPAPLVAAMAASCPLGPDFVLNAYARERALLGYGLASRPA